MSQELEIEFKNMLTSDQFAQLCKSFNVSSTSFFKQLNDYFDTPTLGLREKKSALRIRHVDGKHDLTLKQPHQHAILETHQQLSDQESLEMIQFGIMPPGSVEQAITGLGIDVDQLVHLGQLKTERCQFSYKNGELFLDHSFYLKKEDYELEFEAADSESGKKIFEELLKAHAIERKPSAHKIARLYQAL
ncbi:MAG: CYTH domain-containing protein [Sporolactobacillus sp.]